MRTTPLIALTVRQPWAWAIVTPAVGKDVENRSWRTGHRGPLAIHAARGITRAEYRAAAQFIFERSEVWAPPMEELDYGALIGLVAVTGCVSASESPWFQGPHGITLATLRRLLAPLPCPGQLGLWPVPPTVRAQLFRQGVTW